MQQLSGIDFVLFYAVRLSRVHRTAIARLTAPRQPLLFRQAGLDPNTAAFVASGVTGIVLLITVACANLYINRIGRRTLYILGGVCIASAHFIIGAIYSSGATERSVAARYVVIVAVEWFAVSFAGTW